MLAHWRWNAKEESLSLHRVKSFPPDVPFLFHHGGPALFRHYSSWRGVIYRWSRASPPSTINWSPFSDIEAFGSVISLIFSSLTRHFLVCHFTSSPSSASFSLSSCLVYLSSRLIKPPVPPYFFPSALSLIFSLSLVLLISQLHFLLLLLLAVNNCNIPCHVFGCIIVTTTSFEYLYIAVCVCVYLYTSTDLLERTETSQKHWPRFVNVCTNLQMCPQVTHL